MLLFKIILEDFVAVAFSTVGLDWEEYVVTDSSLLRPSEIAVSKGNPAKAKKNMGWQSQYNMYDVVRMMVESCLNTHPM